MSTTDTRIPTAHPLSRRLVAGLLAVIRVIFWFGVFIFALGNVIDFIPGAEQGWFTVAAILAAFGLFVPQAWYRIGAFAVVGLAILAAFDGHKRGVEYRQLLERRPAATHSPVHQS
jgi:hypothetical protein